MGMDYWANGGWIIEWDNLNKIIPEACKDFEKVLDKYELSIDDFCNAYDYDTDLTELDIDTYAIIEVQNAWDIFSGWFSKATDVNGSRLNIFPGWLHEENDICYDFDNPFFWVTGVEQPTPAGKKFSPEFVKYNTYVSWG